MDAERGLRSAGWRAAAVRGSGGGPGEAAGEHAGPRTSTPRLRPSHRSGPAHRTGNTIRAKKKKVSGFCPVTFFKQMWGKVEKGEKSMPCCFLDMRKL